MPERELYGGCVRRSVRNAVIYGIPFTRAGRNAVFVGIVNSEIPVFTRFHPSTLTVMSARIVFGTECETVAALVINIELDIIIIEKEEISVSATRHYVLSNKSSNTRNSNRV